jgi:ferric-dicitrate binding protein FerR (iron transport regulator)
MPQQDAKSLFDKYQSGQCSPEEQAVVENWLTFGEATGLDLSESELELDAIELKQRIAKISKKPVKLWPRIAVAAAAVATIVFGVWFFNGDTGVLKQVQDDVVQNDIAPGKNGATITLANGKVIKLSDVKSGVVIGKDDLKYSDSTLVIGSLSSRANAKDPDPSEVGMTSKVQNLTASTAKGQTYQFTLSDGTKVWLNADSKISFPSQFSGKERKLLLDGEAYFEVSKDKKHPFVVESKGQFLEVLGTHFNLNAYKDEPQIATTLLEGSVKVSVNGRTQLIRPGQQAVNYGGRLQVNEVSLDDITDWKEGDFFLNHVDFKTAMRKIARWYDVEIVYDVAVPDDLESGGWMSRRNNLSTVLKAIEGTGLARFRIDGKTVHVFK